MSKSEVKKDLGRVLSNDTDFILDFADWKGAANFCFFHFLCRQNFHQSFLFLKDASKNL